VAHPQVKHMAPGLIFLLFFMPLVAIGFGALLYRTAQMHHDSGHPWTTSFMLAAREAAKELTKRAEESFVQMDENGEVGAADEDGDDQEAGRTAKLPRKMKSCLRLLAGTQSLVRQLLREGLTADEDQERKPKDKGNKRPAAGKGAKKFKRLVERESCEEGQPGNAEAELTAGWRSQGLEIPQFRGVSGARKRSFQQPADASATAASAPPEAATEDERKTAAEARHTAEVAAQGAGEVASQRAEVATEGLLIEADAGGASQSETAVPPHAPADAQPVSPTTSFKPIVEEQGRSSSR